MEYVRLVGTEDVQRAAASMREAAQQMSNAAASFEDSLFRQRQFMEEWLGRFEALVESREKNAKL